MSTHIEYGRAVAARTRIVKVADDALLEVRRLASLAADVVKRVP